VTTACEPTTGSTDALTIASHDFPIVLFRRLVSLKPLDTGFEGKH